VRELAPALLLLAACRRLILKTGSSTLQRIFAIPVQGTKSFVAPRISPAPFPDRAEFLKEGALDAWSHTRDTDH
jgi:hypothetical protein